MRQANQTGLQQDKAPFFILPMTESDAADVCGWRYDPPYDGYNWDPWAELLTQGRELADPYVRNEQYRSVWLKQDLIGFIQRFPLASDGSAGVIRLGLGLRPDHCGQGYGPAIARAAVQEALQHFPGWDVDLEVWEDNTRAVKAYKRAGFIVEDRYELPAKGGRRPVLNMVWRG